MLPLLLMGILQKIKELVHEELDLLGRGLDKLSEKIVENLAEHNLAEKPVPVPVANDPPSPEHGANRMIATNQRQGSHGEQIELYPDTLTEFLPNTQFNQATSNPAIPRFPDSWL